MVLKRHLQTQLTAQEDGQPLIDWLAGRFTYHTAEGWAAIVQDGRLLVNNSQTSSSYTTRAGDIITYVPRPKDEPEVILDYDLVHECDDFLVINKPPNLPCHPSGSFFNNTLWALLADSYDGLYLVNRLDRETSGLVLVSRNKQTARELGRQFADKTIKKEYLVLVHGAFPESLRADGVLVNDENSDVRKKRLFLPDQTDDDGDDCSTHFQLIESANELSLVKAFPQTGKFHQIRASLHSLGFPVVGDKIYGRDDSIFIRFVDRCMTADDQDVLMLGHQALHASSLKFELPGYGELRFTAPLPEDFKSLLTEHELNDQ